MIGDSILRFVKNPKLEVVCRPGAKIKTLQEELKEERGKYRKFPFIVVAVGTNNLQGGEALFREHYEDFVLFMKQTFSRSKVFFTTLLPRPRNAGTPLYHSVRTANAFIEHCVHRWEAGMVLYMHTSFLSAGQPVLHFFSDGLHINTPQGVSKYTNTLLSHLGQWCKQNHTPLPLHQLDINYN